MIKFALSFLTPWLRIMAALSFTGCVLVYFFGMFWLFMTPTFVWFVIGLPLIAYWNLRDFLAELRDVVSAVRSGELSKVGANNLINQYIMDQVKKKVPVPTFMITHAINKIKG